MSKLYKIITIFSKPNIIFKSIEEIKAYIYNDYKILFKNNNMTYNEFYEYMVSCNYIAVIECESYDIHKDILNVLKSRFGDFPELEKWYYEYEIPGYSRITPYMLVCSNRLDDLFSFIEGIEHGVYS